MRVLDYGEHAVLAEPDDPRDVPGLRAALAGVDGVIDAVAGATTVLVHFVEGSAQRVRVALDRGEFAVATAAQAPRSVALEVVYDGPDLAAVAEHTGHSVEEVVELHSTARYTVRFCGFAPGFAYLDGLPDALHVPRRSEPRTRVPAGSVGIAGEFAGVYPRASPGGWNLLGRTDARLWDPGRDRPALLTPGTTVRFVRA